MFKPSKGTKYSHHCRRCIFCLGLMTYTIIVENPLGGSFIRHISATVVSRFVNFEGNTRSTVELQQVSAFTKDNRAASHISTYYANMSYSL